MAITGKLTNEKISKNQEIQIPEGWKEVTTLDIVKDPKTSIRIGPFGSSLKKAELVNHGIRVLFIENIVNNRFDFKTGKFITPEKYEQLKGFTVIPGDLLVTMMGTIGRIAIVPENIGTAIISSHLLKISVDPKKILPSFFSLLLKSPLALKQMKKESRGIAMPGLNSKIIKNLKFLLPPLSTQKKIVKISDLKLSEWDKFQPNLKEIEKIRTIQRNYIYHISDTILQKAFSGKLVN